MVGLNERKPLNSNKLYSAFKNWPSIASYPCLNVWVNSFLEKDEENNRQDKYRWIDNSNHFTSDYVPDIGVHFIYILCVDLLPDDNVKRQKHVLGKNK